MTQPEHEKGRPPYPGEECHIPPRHDWTEQEVWVWKQVCEGKIADFNEREGLKEDEYLDPKDEKTEWPESRVLTPNFLETILLHEPYRSAIGRNGVPIIGAWFKEQINLDNAHIRHELYLRKSRFDSDVSFDTTHVENLLSFRGSCFKGKAFFQRLKTEGSLFLSDGALFNGEVNLASANIGGQLAMVGSRFKQKVDMNSLKVATNLFMRDKATFEGEVDLIGADIGGLLEMNGSIFMQKVDMDSLKVATNLFMHDKATFEGEVDLIGASIGDQLSMIGSIFEQKVVMDSLNVGTALFMRDAIFQGEVDLVFSNVGTNLDLRGTEMEILNLSGTIIKGDLRLGRGGKEEKETKWNASNADEVYLILKNVKVGSLQDSASSWPKNIDLEGFTYDRLGGMVESWRKADSIAERDIEWIKGWLYEHVKYKGFSPQPYEQMAKVLRESGHKDKSDKVLYECKELERKNRKDFWGKLNLFLQKIFIGYGYNMRHSLYCSAIILLSGMTAYFKSTLKNADDICFVAAYSLSKFLPVATMARQFDDIKLEGWPLYYFNFHSLMGYVLATFIIAGLTGLTKK